MTKSTPPPPSAASGGTAAKKPDDEEKVVSALDQSDIELLTAYGQGTYDRALKTTETDIQKYLKRITELAGVKESDTGLSPPHLWDLVADEEVTGHEQPLQVARCTKIINGGGDNANAAPL